MGVGGGRWEVGVGGAKGPTLKWCGGMGYVKILSPSAPSLSAHWLKSGAGPGSALKYDPTRRRRASHHWGTVNVGFEIGVLYLLKYLRVLEE